MSRRRGQAAERGYSLVELMVVVGMAGITIGAITRFAFRARLDMLRQEGAGELVLRNARISENLRSTVKTAQLAVVNGGADFSGLRSWVLKSVSATGAPVPAAFSAPLTASPLREPLLSQTAQGLWGDELMLVVEAGPISFTASSTACTEVINVDRLQFVYIYLGKVPGATMPNGSAALRLVEWRSQPVVSFQSISAYVGTNSCSGRLTAAAMALVTAGYSTAFDLSNPSPQATAFYQVLSPTAGNWNCWQFFASGNPPNVAESSWAYLDDFDYVQSYKCHPGLDYGRISRGAAMATITAPSTFSVAYDNVSPNANPTLKVIGLEAPGGNIFVPKYALADENYPGFPGGFEVSMVGAPNSREFFIRHVLMMAGAVRANAPASTYMAQEKSDDITVHLPQ